MGPRQLSPHVSAAHVPSELPGGFSLTAEDAAILKQMPRYAPVSKILSPDDISSTPQANVPEDDLSYLNSGLGRTPGSVRYSESVDPFSPITPLDDTYPAPIQPTRRLLENDDQSDDLIVFSPVDDHDAADEPADLLL